MYNSLKTLVQNTLRPFGIKLSRVYTSEKLIEQEKKQHQWLIECNIKTIIDIGANTGQFAQMIHRILPKARIYSFEPLPDCYDELVASFSGNSQFQAFNLALGNETGKIEMNQNEFSPSSSLLSLGKLHQESFPFAQKQVVQEISIACLDDIAENLELHKPILIKVDVQGFEDRVIAGGIEVFQQASVILIEMSITELYEGQLLFDDIYHQLTRLGFEYCGNYSQAHSPLNYQILYVDGIFMK